mmetsp:Transcript_28981/g.45910  ORF Transcript_28981/g.45910 Transcript_28981/m.45910 type:complete len:144 (-) Transcript_28981:279-710(-)
MNPLQRGLRRPLFNGLYMTRRRVSFQVWDSFGHLKDGSDLHKRASIADLMMINTPWKIRLIFASLLLIPGHFYMYMHGVFDYIFRRRTIEPIPVQWGSKYPFRAPDGYENPLFEPARKWEKIRQKNREARKGTIYGLYREGGS